MKKGGFILFGILLYIIIATGTGIYIKTVSNFEVKKEFIYAEKNIPAKTIITADMLKAKSKPISDGHKLSVSNVNDIVGKMALVDISKDEMLLTSRVVDPNDRTGEIVLNSKDNRKFTIEFKPDQAVGWRLETNQYVDIIFVPNPSNDAAVQNQNNIALASSPTASLQPPKAKGYDKNNITRMKNIRIAGIIDESGNLVTGKSEVLPRYICFEVNNEQDEFLAWAKSNGRLEVSAIPLENEVKEGK